MQLGPVFGMIGTSFAMVRAFEALERKDAVGDPSELSVAVGESLIASMVGMGVSWIGAVLMLVAVFWMKYRGAWLFWVLAIVGGIYLLVFPLGTILGVVFLAVAIPKRHEFRRESSRG